jgi:glycopeptide antibiotics resistance protein
VNSQKIKWVLLAIIGLAVLFGGLFPKPVPVVFEHADKVYHFLAFCSLTLIGLLTLPNKKLFLTLIILLSFSIEGVQGWLLTQRFMSLWDLIMNFLGIAVGIVMYLLQIYIKRIWLFKD